MKVLVTGSSGFIGTAVGAELEARGHEMVPFDRPHDIRDGLKFRSVVRESDAGAVINLAGVLGAADLLGTERYAADVNILGALAVFDVARDAGIPLVQIGTGHKGQPNPYAITKACAEELGLARANWLGQKIAVVRAYNAYGPGQIPGFPYGPATVHKFFPTFACRALDGRVLELYGGGSQVIDPVHVSDVAAVLVGAIGGPYGEVTDAGNGKPVTVREVAADVLAAAVGARGRLADLPGRMGEPLDAEVVARNPACGNPWPYLVAETVAWYRDFLAR